MRSTTVTGGVAAGRAAADAAVSALVEAVRGGELRFAGHQELCELLREVRGLQARLDYVGLAAVRQVDARRSFLDDGALSAGAWARMHTRMTPAEASAAVRTARALGSGELPATGAALAAGVIDPAHVRVIAAGVAGAPAGAAALIEHEALAVAAVADPRAVATVMARFAHALDPDAADAAALARYDRRGLTLCPLPDGSVHIRGLADEVTGALLMTAISAASPPAPGETRSPAQRRLDGLGELARHYLAHPDAPRSGGGHAHLIVTLEASSLIPPDHRGDEGRDRPAPADDTGESTGEGAGQGAGEGLEQVLAAAAQQTRAGAGPGATLCWVGPITASTARRVACDADVTYVAVNDHGGAQVLGREQRFFNWAQRKAMIARDGDRCAVPFCDRPISWADAHHLKDWALGGLTVSENGALPYAAHHTLLHEGGWTLTRQPDGGYIIRHRSGKTIGPEPHPPGHNRPPPHPRH